MDRPIIRGVVSTDEVVQGWRIDGLILAAILSVVICTTGMWYLPAIGARSEHGMGAEPWRETILALRRHTMGTVATTTGIITMPSFHGALAVLLAWTARGWRFVFPVSVTLNATMAISAMTEGAHYGVDIAARAGGGDCDGAGRAAGSFGERLPEFRYRRECVTSQVTWPQ